MKIIHSRWLSNPTIQPITLDHEIVAGGFSFEVQCLTKQRNPMSIKKKSSTTKTAKDDFFSNLNNPQHILSLSRITPLTPNQERLFTLFNEGHNIFVHGWAGTGKTLLSLYLGLRDVLDSETPRDKIIIVRSVVPSRDMGFMPGNMKEKSKVYELPYADAAAQLVAGSNSYEVMKSKGVIEFTTTSFLRGLTFTNAVIYIDEIQNLADHEIHTVMTRIGDGCRVIVSGDVRQTDFMKDPDRLGCMTFIRTVQNMSSFRSVEFGIEDILRSSFVKEYLIARDKVMC